MVIAVAIAIFVFLLGPIVFIVSGFVEGTGNYLFQFVPMSFRTGVGGGSEWLNGWTILYWAWWISWTPFVGTFLAHLQGPDHPRVHAGRPPRPERREHGVVRDLRRRRHRRAAHRGGRPDRRRVGGVLFALLETYPFVTVTSVLVIFLVGLFFVSGADAASVVMGTMSTHGSHRRRGGWSLRGARSPAPQPRSSSAEAWTPSSRSRS